MGAGRFQPPEGGWGRPLLMKAGWALPRRRGVRLIFDNLVVVIGIYSDGSSRLERSAGTPVDRAGRFDCLQ